MGLWVDLELYCGSPGGIKRKIHCAYCGKTVEQPASYLIYKSDFDKAIFCSYNCRCAYYKKYEKKRDLFFHPEEKKCVSSKRKKQMYSYYRKCKMAMKQVKDLDLTGISEIVCYKQWGNQKFRIKFDKELLAEKEVRKLNKEGDKLVIEVSCKDIKKWRN